jgi:hypothetical protein
MSSNTYDVGYGKPPKHSQFKPGHSGNPKGRAKGTRNLATDLAEELSEKLVVTEGGKPKRITKQRALIKALVAKSIKGDPRAAAALLRLIPDAEQARKAATQAQTLNSVDQDILDAFREQLREEIAAGSDP